MKTAIDVSSSPAVGARRTWLTTRDAAVYLGVSTAYLRKLRTRRLLDGGSQGPPFHRKGASLVLYRVEDLDSWVLDGAESGK